MPYSFHQGEPVAFNDVSEQLEHEKENPLPFTVSKSERKDIYSSVSLKNVGKKSCLYKMVTGRFLQKSKPPTFFY